MGRVDGDDAPAAGTAEIITEDTSKRLSGLLRREYGMEYRIVMARERLSRSGPSERVILRIAPA